MENRLSPSTFPRHYFAHLTSIRSTFGIKRKFPRGSPFWAKFCWRWWEYEKESRSKGTALSLSGSSGCPLGVESLSCLVLRKKRGAKPRGGSTWTRDLDSVGCIALGGSSSVAPVEDKPRPTLDTGHYLPCLPTHPRPILSKEKRVYGRTFLKICLRQSNHGLTYKLKTGSPWKKIIVIASSRQMWGCEKRRGWLIGRGCRGAVQAGGGAGCNCSHLEICTTATCLSRRHALHKQRPPPPTLCLSLASFFKKAFSLSALGAEIKVQWWNRKRFCTERSEKGQRASQSLE